MPYKEFCVFSRESYFIKAIENFFPVFAYPDINTRVVGRILDSYANPLVFISGYANTENVFYCLISARFPKEESHLSWGPGWRPGVKI